MDSIVEKIFQACTQYSDNIAIIEGDSQLTYRDIHDIILKFATVLQEQGIQKGDKVGLMMLNETYYFPSLLAVLVLEAIPVPINLMYSQEELFHVFTHADITAVVVNRDICAKYAESLAQTPLPINIILSEGEDFLGFKSIQSLMADSSQYKYEKTVDLINDPAILMYTSGTTAKPKGVILSNNNIVSNLTGLSPVLKFTPEETVLLALPKFHTFGQIVGLLTLVNGGKIVLVSKFTPNTILVCCADHKVTVLPLVPTMFSLLTTYQKKHQYDLSSLRFCVSGGAALPVQLLNTIEEVLKVPVVEGYGLTETSPVVALNTEHEIPGSIGKTIEGVSVKIINDDEQEVDRHQVGEIAVHGPNVMLGYYKNAPETASAFTQDGWFKTGDMGYKDEANNLYISAERKKDLIICAGENISPRSIEEVLYTYNGIVDCAVVGVQHNKLGEEIAAFYTTENPLDEQELKKYCIEKLAPHKVPKYFFHIEEIPKNAVGKILKRVLREQAQHQVSAVIFPS